jgi:hypothetical protein
LLLLLILLLIHIITTNDEIKSKSKIKSKRVRNSLEVSYKKSEFRIELRSLHSNDY